MSAMTAVVAIVDAAAAVAGGGAEGLALVRVSR